MENNDKPGIEATEFEITIQQNFLKAGDSIQTKYCSSTLIIQYNEIFDGKVLINPNWKVEKTEKGNNYITD